MREQPSHTGVQLCSLAFPYSHRCIVRYGSLVAAVTPCELNTVEMVETNLHPLPSQNWQITYAQKQKLM